MVRAEGAHLELVEPENAPFISKLNSKAHRLTIGRLIRAIAHNPHYYDLDNLKEEEIDDLLGMGPVLFRQWLLHSGSVDGFLAQLLRDAIAGGPKEPQGGVNVNVTQAPGARNEEGAGNRGGRSLI